MSRPAACPRCGCTRMFWGGYNVWDCGDCEYAYVGCLHCDGELPKLMDVHEGRASSHARGACLGVALPPEEET